VGPVTALAGLQMLTAMIFFLNPTQIPFFAAALGYDSASATGAYLGVLMLSGGCTALLYSRTKARLGDAGGYAAGFALMALGFALLPDGAEFWLLLFGAALIGAGYAVVTPIFIAIALQLAPVQRRGLVGGIMATTMFLGQFASPFASIPAIAAFGYDLVFYGTAIALAAMAGIAVAAAIMRQRLVPGLCTTCP